MRRVAIFLLANLATGVYCAASYQQAKDVIVYSVLTRDFEVHADNDADRKCSFNTDAACLKNAFFRETNMENGNITRMDHVVLNKTISPFFTSYVKAIPYFHLKA